MNVPGATSQVVLGAHVTTVVHTLGPLSKDTPEIRTPL